MGFCQSYFHQLFETMEKRKYQNGWWYYCSLKNVARIWLFLLDKNFSFYFIYLDSSIFYVELSDCSICRTWLSNNYRFIIFIQEVIYNARNGNVVIHITCSYCKCTICQSIICSGSCSCNCISYCHI